MAEQDQPGVQGQDQDEKVDDTVVFVDPAKALAELGGVLACRGALGGGRSRRSP